MGVKDTIGNVTSNVLNTVMGSGIFQPVLVPVSYTHLTLPTKA